MGSQLAVKLPGEYFPAVKLPDELHAYSVDRVRAYKLRVAPEALDKLTVFSFAQICGTVKIEGIFSVGFLKGSRAGLL